MNTIDKILNRLENYPQLEFEVEYDCISTKAATDSGFSVWIAINNPGFTVGFDGWHEEFESELEALDAFAFGLSDRCRIMVSKRGNTEYQWALESRDGDNWIEDSSTGFLFIPFWRKKTVEYRQNNIVELD